MSETPNPPVPDDDQQRDPGTTDPEGAPGAEVGMSEEGSTFEPEEDPKP